jgi:EAL domain-containing protein (putative c-di-GMP-specific phosphodiesterase class I)
MQASMLRDWGVTYLQGHLVGRAELVTETQPERRRAVG